MPSDSTRTKSLGKQTRGVIVPAFSLLAQGQVPLAASATRNAAVPNSKEVTLKFAALDADGHPHTDPTDVRFQDLWRRKAPVNRFFSGARRAIRPGSSLDHNGGPLRAAERREYESQWLVRTIS